MFRGFVLLVVVFFLFVLQHIIALKCNFVFFILISLSFNYKISLPACLLPLAFTQNYCKVGKSKENQTEPKSWISS